MWVVFFQQMVQQLHKMYRLLLGGLWLWAMTLCVIAEDPGILSVQFENDFWGQGSDRHFTHGTRISYTPGGDVPAWIDAAAKQIPFFNTQGDLRVSYAFGQSIFTPENISQRALVFPDRPYAGWLYGGVGLIANQHRDPQKAWQRVFDLMELNLGLIGPESFADDTQINWHKAVGAARPRGWKNQLKTNRAWFFIMPKNGDGKRKTRALIFHRAWEEP